MAWSASVSRGVGWCLLLLPVLLPITSCQMTTNQDPCLICRNGPNAGTCQELPCKCSFNGENYFWGDLCEFLDLSNVSRTITPRTVNFTWDSPPDLQGQYSFVYRRARADERDSTEPSPNLQEHGFDKLYHARLSMLDENTTRLTELTADNVLYVVCILDSQLADQVTQDKNISRVNASYKDCVFVETARRLVWPYELSFYIITALMLATVLSLMVLKVICDRYKYAKSGVKVSTEYVKDDKPLVVETLEDKSVTNSAMETASQVEIT